MLLLLVICALGGANTAWASGENFGTGAKASAMGHTSLTQPDAFSTHNNQAALGFMDRIAFGIYSERRYLLADINLLAGTIVLPTKTGVFGLSFNYYGFELYNEKKAGLAFGKKFGDKFAAGLQLDYLNINIAEYGQKHLVTAEVGMLYKALPQLSLAAHLYNPIPLEVAEFEEEKLPTIMKFGLSYHPSDKVVLAAEMEKDLDHPARFKGGLQYSVLTHLDVRAGVSTNPTVGTFGLGINWSVHPVLGVTPRAGLVYALKKRPSKPAPASDL